MLSFLPWLLALSLTAAHAAPGSGLRAVKAGTKHAKNAKRRTLQEWREEQMRTRMEEAKKRRAEADPAPEPTAPAEIADPAAPEDATETTAPPAAAPDKGGKAKRKTEEAPPTWLKRNLRKIEALLALLTLWLITRLYEKSSAKNRRQPPPRPSPVSAEELGRTVFSIGRSKDIDAYRALFLTGAEAVQTLGTDQAKQYLSRRDLTTLELAYGQLTQRLPSGSSYVKTELTAMHQCILHVATPDGSGRTLQIGTVVEVGAVLRLVAPNPPKLAP
jgi:hypothetical protein